MIHLIKNHLQRRLIRNILCFKNRREPLILLTILFSLITESVVFSIDYDFQTHYIVGFTRSLILFMMCLFTMSLTVSIRIFTLMLLLITSMSFDLLVLINSNFYWILKSTRGVFSDIYRIFELLTITYTGLSHVVACNTDWLLSKVCKHCNKNTPT